MTGASSGIGEELAYTYASHGANVVIVARRENRLKQVLCLILSSYSSSTDMLKVLQDMLLTNGQTIVRICFVNYTLGN